MVWLSHHRTSSWHGDDRHTAGCMTAQCGPSTRRLQPQVLQPASIDLVSSTWVDLRCLLRVSRLVPQHGVCKLERVRVQLQRWGSRRPQLLDWKRLVARETHSTSELLFGCARHHVSTAGGLSQLVWDGRGWISDHDHTGVHHAGRPSRRKWRSSARSEKVSVRYQRAVRLHPLKGFAVWYLHWRRSQDVCRVGGFLQPRRDRCEDLRRVVRLPMQPRVSALPPSLRGYW